MRVLWACEPSLALRGSVEPSTRMLAGKYPADNASREVLPFLAFLFTKQRGDPRKEKSYSAHVKTSFAYYVSLPRGRLSLLIESYLPTPANHQLSCQSMSLRLTFTSRPSYQR